MTPEELRQVARLHRRIAKGLRDLSTEREEHRKYRALAQEGYAEIRQLKARVTELEAERAQVRQQALEYRAEMVGKQRTTAERLLAAEARVRELEALLATAGGAA